MNVLTHIIAAMVGGAVALVAMVVLIIGRD